MDEKNRRGVYWVLGLLVVPGICAMGFLPDSVMMLLEGEYCLSYQVWIEWSPEGFDA